MLFSLVTPTLFDKAEYLRPYSLLITIVTPTLFDKFYIEKNIPHTKQALFPPTSYPANSTDTNSFRHAKAAAEQIRLPLEIYLDYYMSFLYLPPP